MKSTDTLVMEKVPPVLRPAEPAGGMIKSILFAVHEDDQLEARLQAALSIARSCSAHLQLLQVVPIDAYAAMDSYGGAFISGEILEALQQEADKLRIKLEQHLKLEDVSWNYELATSVVLPELIQHAALADMMVVGREPHFHEFSRTGLSLLGELICRARTPVCIPGDEKASVDPFGTAVVAWNGSIEAANAVRSAIGLLKMASEVRVVRYTEDKDLSLSDERLLEYLSRHDVHALMDTHLTQLGITEDLLNYASAMDAEYLLMGGYSHSRAGEFLFGGVTRALLRACPISLVMAH